ncbi:RNA polymerase sigma-70 factor [Salibacterium halotolerans]|uniref:RNA polymerase sigma-70 factor, ECF subfamily n=1 Tax=Salibacterium halotolerans TaxID=1884432 RepID=A0A1I5WTN8_9BACI|nr:RNA polymerase sigma-70 factor [Salibacterium halotolerans]SFQ23115.1 RNA polymerase sigma-70 factor, ECF subfamily [Salibacterium halotolerans]
METFETWYKMYQPYVFAIAYRMLGSITEAEDIIQDIFMDLHERDTSCVHNMKAYLAKMTTNRCLNLLHSAQKRREIYPGPWLPEPHITQREQPLDKMLQEESVSYAFLVLLERLSPVERAVFVLREAFRFHYSETADILHRTENNCRKLYSRAKQKIPDEPVFPEQSNHTARLTNTFLHAAETGDFEAFINLLTDDVVFYSDGGGNVKAATKPVFFKKRVRALLQGIAAKGSFSGNLYPILINGQTGILQIQEGSPVKVICFRWDREQKNIQNLYFISNPDKLPAL